MPVSPRGTPVEVVGRGELGVVLVAEVWGVDDSLRWWADRLAAEGCTVAMPDPWWRVGGPPEMGTPAAISAAVASIDDGELLRDIVAAREIVGRPKVVVMGFCMGGTAARAAACTLPGLVGAIEFYGRIVYPTLTERKAVQPLDLLPGLSCALQCHFGADDPVAPPHHVQELERRLAALPVPSQVFRYPGCGHAFARPGGPNWNPDAAELAWSRVLAFVDHLA